MKRFLHFIFAAGFLAASVAALANDESVPATAGAGAGQPTNDRIIGQVRHELRMIPQLTIFDDLSFKVDGSTLTLLGEVRNPVIKDEAQARVKHIEGVEQVKNQIEVLPVSFNDDRIRRQVALAIFHDPRLSLYAIQPVPSIHIIVKNGHVDLQGVVRDQGDKDVAGIRANGVSGVFSVQNDLRLEKS